ncbi:putative nicotinate-nucleotide adenylyltransferase [Chlamydiales bacterium STE3]|nr:putative nicotinate-nucleotide adenylyltransferase [Chlamydiales bacterium STE3]
MKIGFYGGSFDPIHFGHINLAIELKEQGNLDEVWFCPAFLSPGKQTLPIEGKLRYEMISLALKEIPGFKVIDLELKCFSPSYTVETLRTLKAQFPQHEWFLLLGEDSLNNFLSWKEPEEILSLAKPLVGSRFSHFLNKKLDWSETYLKVFESGWRKIPIFEISSTYVRERLVEGLYCGHLLPRKVLDFINNNQLYSSKYEKS